MCNKNSTCPIPTAKSIMKKKKQKISFSSSFVSSTTASSSSSSSLKPVKRRNRRKKKKPKYLSLRLQLSQTQTLKEAKKTTNEENEVNLFTESENPEENNVALLFDSDGGGTLKGLLEDESTTTVTAGTSDEGSLSAMRCRTMEGLVRKAMRRGRSDEGSEERWVCYSEVTSSTVETTSFGSLSLKLDHEGILNAWSDKGSLYVDGEDAPQTVPDLFDASSSFLHPLHPNVGWDSYGCDVVGKMWKVPENSSGNGISVKEEMGWKVGQREASVMRYKEKRRNRLFAKRIRYEVRKLNAEKRPRMKGRFVKRE